MSDLNIFAQKRSTIAMTKKYKLIFFFIICSLNLNVFLTHFPKSNIKTFLSRKPLGKRNGKKWSQIWKLLLIKSVKLLRAKKIILGKFCLTSRIFVDIGETIRIGQEIFWLPFAGFLLVDIPKAVQVQIVSELNLCKGNLLFSFVEEVEIVVPNLKCDEPHLA